MQIVGQYDTDGNYVPYTEAQEVSQLGSALISEWGFTVAVKDEYGDWVSPTLARMGLKSVIEVVE